VKFLACCVLPDTKLYGDCLYWCKYIRDFDGATQWLKATVPDRRVWLPTPVCVIVAMHISKGPKDAHSKGPSNLYVLRPRGSTRPAAVSPIGITTANLLRFTIVNLLKTPSLTNKKICKYLNKFRLPNGAWNLCQICFIVILLVNCLDKELIAYKTLSKYFIQVLTFVTLVHTTQTVTRLVQITHCIHKTNFKISLPQPVNWNLMLRSPLQQITEKI